MCSAASFLFLARAHRYCDVHKVQHHSNVQALAFSSSVYRQVVTLSSWRYSVSVAMCVHTAPKYLVQGVSKMCATIPHSVTATCPMLSLSIEEVGHNGWMLEVCLLGI